MNQQLTAISPPPTIMKSNFIPLVVAFLLLFTGACSNDIELNAPEKEIAIVYGLLSPQDEVHYVRIERAFLEENTSALELAQRPDQLYFDNLVVELTRMGDGEIFQLQEVDGTVDGIIREEGIFSSSPNILYRIADSQINLQQGEIYVLSIRQAGSEETLASASTAIVGTVRLNRPIPGNNKLPLRIEEDESFTLLWAADETARFFDVKMTIHLEEQQANNIANRRTLTWTIARNITAMDGPNRISFEGVEFYRFLANTLAEEAVRSRRVRAIDIRIDVGGEELFNYINVGQANTGITSSQVIPTYTNIENGLGIFSSRNQFLEEGFSIDGITREGLKNSELTRGLNFE